MTIGNKTVNLLQTRNGTGIGCIPPSYVVTGLTYGTFRSRVWSGGDAPQYPKPAYTLKSFSYPLYSYDGKKVLKMRRKSFRDYGPKGPPREKRRQGEHGYEATIIDNFETIFTVYNTAANCTNHSTPWVEDSTYNGFGILNSISNPFTANDNLRLYSKLSDRISQEGFNMAVFLGEGKQSLQTIAGAATRIAYAYKALRKGRVKAAAKILVGSDKKKLSKVHTDASGKFVTPTWVSQNWLELMYGWLPLVGDIGAAAAHFASMQNRPQTLTYRSVIRKNNESLISSSPSYKLGGDIASVKVVKAILTKIDEVALLGLKDPASLAWEKLPWSFVADWVIPIGTYLEALNLNRALSGTYVITTYNCQTVTSATSTTSNTSFNAVFRHRRVYVKREIVSSLPVPRPEVKPWADIPSWIRAGNAIALLRQAFAH